MENKMSLTPEELMIMLFGSNQYIVQKRSHMHCVFTFNGIDEAKKTLSEMSHDPDTTFVYYNGDVLTSRQFTETYGGYEYVQSDDDKSNNSFLHAQEEDNAEPDGCCCSDGVCSF